MRHKEKFRELTEKKIHNVSIYINNAWIIASNQTKPDQTEPVPNLRNTKYFLFVNIFRRITPFKKKDNIFGFGFERKTQRYVTRYTLIVVVALKS